MPLIRPFVSKQMEQEFKAFLKARKAERQQKLAAEIAAESARIRAEREAANRKGLQKLIYNVQQLKAVRVFQFFSGKSAPLVASGLAYQAIFALFAALWFAFSILGFAFAGNKSLQHGLVSGVNDVAPGLIGGKGSAVSLDVLLNAGVLGWSSVIALVTILLTTVGFVGTLRNGLLIIFERKAPKRNVVVQKVMDLGLVIIFGVLLLVTAVVSVVTAVASAVIFNLLHIPTDNWFAYAVAGFIGLVVVALLDSVVLVGVMRLVAGVKVPLKRLMRTAVGGGLALAFLQTLGSGLLGAPKNNPLFTSFAVIFGLLVYFNIVCEIVLFCAAWLKVGSDDRANPIDDNKTV